MALSGPGLYLHVPYCRSICPYCDFNVYRAGAQAPFAELAHSLAQEMTVRAPAFAGPLGSVYFGGGTPSLMPPDLVASLIAHAHATFGLVDGAEITLEADPGTIDAAGLRALRAGGVNRLSIGWQSSHDTLLRTLGRPHRAAAGEEAVAMARAAGFDALSLDLIFAVPGQTMAHLEADLQRLVALRPEHVSLYALTYHGQTPMARRLERGTITAAPEELELAMMQRIHDHLTQAGFDHYETSNFARPGAQAVHNSLYWSYDSYLGLGPGAHSFVRDGRSNKAVRWGNLKLPAAYMAQMAKLHQQPRAPEAATPPTQAAAAAGTVDFVEELTALQQVLERMMVGLRLRQGVALPPVRGLLETDGQRAQFDAAVAQVLRSGWGLLEGDTLVPTAAGTQLCDSAAALFAL